MTSARYRMQDAKKAVQIAFIATPPTYDQPKLRPEYHLELHSQFNNYLIYVFIFVEETSFLLFCNRKTTEKNFHRSAGGWHSISFSIFDLLPIRQRTTGSERAVVVGEYLKGRFTHSMQFPCRAHSVPLPCRAAKGLEFVFPIWFTQSGRVWFTLAMSWHGKCESDTGALCKSNGKDTF